MILPCQAMFGLERGNQIKQLVQATTGDDCPCMKGQCCPLLEWLDARVEEPAAAS